MEVVTLIGSYLAGGAMSAVMSTVASFAFVVLVSLLPTYIALYRKCFRRAMGLAWVVLIADVGLLGMPPFGIALWLAAFAYAFAPRKRRAPARIKRPIAV